METLSEHLKTAGFIDIQITLKENSAEIIKNWNFGMAVEKFVSSAYIRAFKPL